MLCGWASIGETGKVRGNKPGDQTGREVKVGSWYQFGQNEVLRWKDPKLAAKYAKVIKALCENECIGYDQDDRVTLYNELKRLKWDYTKLTKKCECDCSELIACAVNCTMKKEVVPSWIYTGNLKTLLIATGLFTALTGSKYISSSEYIAQGDVINASTHHVISALESGVKAGVTSKAEGKSLAAEPTLRRGSSGSEVKKLQKNLNKLKIKDAAGEKLKEDGIYGACTYEAVNRFQKKYKLETDGIYGPKSYEKMKKLIK